MLNIRAAYIIPHLITIRTDMITGHVLSSSKWLDHTLKHHTMLHKSKAATTLYCLCVNFVSATCFGDSGIWECSLHSNGESCQYFHVLVFNGFFSIAQIHYNLSNDILEILSNHFASWIVHTNRKFDQGLLIHIETLNHKQFWTCICHTSYVSHCNYLYISRKNHVVGNMFRQV